MLIVIVKFWNQSLLSRVEVLLGISQLSFLVVVAVRSERSCKVKVIKRHVSIPIVTSEPVHQVFLFKIGAEVELEEENPKIIDVDLAVCELIDGSKDFNKGVIIEAHEFLLKGFNTLDTCDFFLKNPNYSEFDVVRELDPRVVESVGEVLLCALQVGLTLVGYGTQQLGEIKQTQMTIGVRVEGVDQHVGVCFWYNLGRVMEVLDQIK